MGLHNWRHPWNLEGDGKLIGMIRKCGKPDVFKDLGEFYWIEAYDKDGAYAYVAIDFRVEKTAIIHLEVLKFSHRILKSLVADWEGIKHICKQNDVKTVAAARTGTIEEHRTWVKFIRWFGFIDVKQIVNAIQEI